MTSRAADESGSLRWSSAGGGGGEVRRPPARRRDRRDERPTHHQPARAAAEVGACRRFLFPRHARCRTRPPGRARSLPIVRATAVLSRPEDGESGTGTPAIRSGCCPEAAWSTTPRTACATVTATEPVPVGRSVVRRSAINGPGRPAGHLSPSTTTPAAEAPSRLAARQIALYRPGRRLRPRTAGHNRRPARFTGRIDRIGYAEDDQWLDLAGAVAIDAATR